MEEEIEKNKDHPQIAPIYFPAELHRAEALSRDLEYFYGEDWQSQVSWKPSEPITWHNKYKVISPLYIIISLNQLQLNWVRHELVLISVLNIISPHVNIHFLLNSFT